MNREDHPSLLLADRYVIPMLLYIGEHEECTRSDIYAAVARSVNTPGKIDMLESIGLVESTVVGGVGRLTLTGVGAEVVERIREIDALIRGQSPKGP